MIEGNFSLARRKYIIDKQDTVSIMKSNLPSYTVMVKVSDLFNKHFSLLIKKSDHKSILNIIYKMELTGAPIFVNRLSCIIVEERKNSIIVVYSDNSRKILIKQDLVFYIEKDGVRYGLLGRNLKINRFLKR